MLDVLADNPVLTLFLVVALGMSPARSGGLIAGSSASAARPDGPVVGGPIVPFSG